MARLTISLLGPLLVRLGDDEVTEFGYDKVRALLVYLAVEAERVQRREALAALLWPEQPDQAARNNLRRALLTLRAAIGDQDAAPPFLLIARDTIQFNRASDHTLDVAAFQALLAACDAHTHPLGELCIECVARLEQAVALYRGDFLAQFALRESVAFSEWALVIRERLHRQALGALARLLAYYEQTGADEAAQDYARRLLALEPWDEAAHRCMMRVFSRQGRRNAALAQYARCRQVLAEELGIEPAAETTALYERIRAGPLEHLVGAPASGRSPAPASQLPPAPPSSTPESTAKAPRISTAHRLEVPALPEASADTRPTPRLTDQIAALHRAGARDAAAPLAAHPATADRNRSRMLAKVRRFWIDGILEQSLHGAALIELGLAYQPEAVERPWNLVVQQPGQPQRSIPHGTPIVQAYDELDGELLILGAPGSGKTTTLLQLARDLIARVEQNPELPMPVVFNLSSWAAQRRSLAEWLVEELSARYQVPRRIGRAWVEAEQVLPLLDGLDEVALDQRTACVEAINRFREEHWLLDLVVCSRSADYEVLTAKLRLQGAVVVQPLTEAQVDAYLAQGGEQLAAVRALMEEDAALRELVDTPLMLAIMALAYRDKPIDELRVRASLEERRKHLFDSYVQRMFARRGSSSRYTPQQTLHWLAWLARTMMQRSQSIFFIEGLQPDLLPSWRQRRLYAGGVGFVVGLVAGMFAVLANLLAMLVRGGPNGALTRLGLLLLAGSSGALCGGALGMALGVVVLEQDGVRSRRRAKARHAAWLAATLALAYGLTGWVAVGSFAIWPSLALVGVTIGLMTQPGWVVAVERYRWSWVKTQARLPWILCFSLLGGIFYGAKDGLVPGVGFGLVGMFVYSLALGLSTDEIEARTIANQGIWRSARNTLQIVVLLGIVAALSVTAFFSWSEGVVEGLALGSGAATVGALLGGLVYGGLTCIQHLVLRILLWRSGAMPWNYASFLDYAADRLFLRKVGGGYIFVHRLLLEHFVSLDAMQTDLAARPSPEPLPAHTAPLALTSTSIRQDDQTGILGQSSETRGGAVHKSTLMNLPIPPTPLIGRDQDIALLRARILDEQTRLLTLVGPPGVGKTRLGFAVAAALRDAFDDGVYLVELAPTRDPSLVPAAIAQPLDVKEVGDRPLVELLKSYLCDKALLLVLDNFEHVLPAAPLVAELLAACPRLTILATSRAPLHVRAERLFPVAPLALPDPSEHSDAATLAQSPAVALFVERAQAVVPDFTLTDGNAAAVAAICTRLDGLPLAIELAAAHVGARSLDELLAQLDSRLAILAHGPRDLPERQQTLRTAIDWSYDLLSMSEQRLFAHLGVFVGGCTLEAAEAVCNLKDDPPVPVLDGLTALTQKSLLQHGVGTGGEPRFNMLETVCEYALERLRASGEAEETQQRHAMHYLALAEEASPHMWSKQIQVWLPRLQRDHDNLRAALGWLQKSPGGLPETLRLAGLLWPFWAFTGQFSEGRAWLGAALARLTELDTSLTSARAYALLGAGVLAWYQGDTTEVEARGVASLTMYRQFEDRWGMAISLILVGHSAAIQGDLTRGIEILEDSLALSRAIGDSWLMAFTLGKLGGLMLVHYGADARVSAVLREAVSLSRSVGHPYLIATALRISGAFALLEQDINQAYDCFAESLALCRAMGDRLFIAVNLHHLADVVRRRRDDEAANRYDAESHRLQRELGIVVQRLTALDFL